MRIRPVSNQPTISHPTMPIPTAPFELASAALPSPSALPTTIPTSTLHHLPSPRLLPHLPALSASRARDSLRAALLTAAHTRAAPLPPSSLPAPPRPAARAGRGADKARCANGAGAAALAACPHAELGGGGGEGEALFVRDGASGAPVPRWRPAGVSAPVFCAGVHGKERMEVLVGVAKALAEAHRVGWLHRRLAPQCVVVPVGFGGGGGLEMSAVSEVEGGEGGAGFVKVLQFSCAITGCGGGCEPCAARNAKAAKRRADLHQRYGTLEHSDVFCCDLDAAYEAPMEYDVRSFAKFLLWLYAGRMDEEDEAGYEDCLGDPEGDLAKVPWPLRWIVVDAERPGEEGVKNLTMEVVLMFLEALRSGRATPHDGGDGYLPAARQKEETQSVYLRAACMRSAAVGMMTLEPEACMHMGRFWEEDAEYHRQMVYGAGEAVCGVGFGNAGNAQARQEYCNAVECFAVAARLGCAQGLVEIARVDALSLRCPFYMRDGVSRCTTLRLLLAAAVLGNIQARCCLAAVPSAGVDNLPELIAQPAGKGSWLLAVEPQLLEACVGVAKCWRRGQADLPVDLEEAEAWLEVAVNRGHPGAALECGLLFVQDANTPSRMEKGVDLVRRASHSFPSPAGKEAYFWLAHWHSLRLRWEPIVTPPPNSSVEPAIVVDKDPVKAAVYAKAASDAEHNDAMAMYSRLLRLGHSPVVKNVDASKRLNKRARDANSGAAFYGYALRKIAEARKAWNGRNKMMIIDASQRGTRSPSAGPASVASVDVISAYRNIPAPLSRYEEPASSPTVSHVTSGSSVTASSVPPLSMSPVPQREVATSGRTSGYRSRVGLGLPRNRDASGISSSTRGPGSAAPGRGSVVAKHVRENSNVGSASDLRRSASGSTNSIPNAVGRLDSAMSKVEVGNEVLVDLETGLLTPAGIVVHLQNALTAYLAPFSEVDENGAHRMPVESANPRPLFLAATCILDNMLSNSFRTAMHAGFGFIDYVCTSIQDMWASAKHGSSDGPRAVERSKFVESQRKYAERLLETAAMMDSNLSWGQMRVNFVAVDRACMKEARELLASLYSD